MRKLILYPAFSEKGQDLSKCKRTVVPNQSMSLKEIIRRFVKKESLPQSKEGTYFEGDYDLEKLSKADRTIQDEVIQEIKADVKVKKSKAEKAVKDSKVQSDPKAVPDPVEPPIVPT